MSKQSNLESISQIGDREHISKIQKQTEFTINSIKEQTTKYLEERGDELKQLQDKADNLSKTSSSFEKCAINLKRKQKKLKLRLTCLIIFLIFFLVLIIVILTIFVVISLTKK